MFGTQLLEDEGEVLSTVCRVAVIKSARMSPVLIKGNILRNKMLDAMKAALAVFRWQIAIEAHKQSFPSEPLEFCAATLPCLLALNITIENCEGDSDDRCKEFESQMGETVKNIKKLTDLVKDVVNTLDKQVMGDRNNTKKTEEKRYCGNTSSCGCSLCEELGRTDR